MPFDMHKEASLADRVVVDTFLSSLPRLQRCGMEETQWNEVVSIPGSVCVSSSSYRLDWSFDTTDMYTFSSARSFINAGSLINEGFNIRWNS